MTQHDKPAASHSRPRAATSRPTRTGAGRTGSDDGRVPTVTDADDDPAITQGADASVRDTLALMAGLLDRLADAQVRVVSARMGGLRPEIEGALLQLRAVALLLASIPAPDDDSRRFAIIAVAALRAGDDDAASHARLMVECAIGIDEARWNGGWCLVPVPD